MSVSLYFGEVTAAAAMVEVYPATNSGHFIHDIMIKMKVHTTDPSGVLLCTLRYNDGEVNQDLNVSLTLATPGDYTVAAWPDLWVDTAQNFQVQFQYLIAGGTADVEIQMRNT